MLSGRHIEAFNIDANEGGASSADCAALMIQASSRPSAASTRIRSALCHGAPVAKLTALTSRGYVMSSVLLRLRIA